MRIGYTTSIIGHTVMLALGLVSLPGAKPFEVEQIDALPVDLVPIDEVTALSEGLKTAEAADTASQANVTAPKPRPESERAGAAPTDQDTPITEKATETAAAPVTEPPPPPPPPPPAARAEPLPEPPAPEPPEPVTEAAPPPEPVPEKPAVAAPEPQAEVAELAAEPKEAAVETPPAPVPPSVKPRVKPSPPKPVQTASAEATASTERRPSETRTPQRLPSEAEAEKPVKEFDPTEMAALLNKVDPSGGGARSSAQDASFGSQNVTGSVPRMSQSEIDALRAAIYACWEVPAGADGLNDLVVPIRVEFNVDGTLASDPVALSVPPGMIGQVVADAALRAVRRCAPYPFLPPEKFDHWRVVNINFAPQV
ncbi:MAG TPA: cell envelope biogenesis protein TolA [Methylomirabilota bacterium]|nr:cell envelope biogenesis protein TolA [Methylomirabilota bacterium]